MDNITENNISSILDDTEEQKSRDRGSESIIINRNLFTNTCQSSSIFVFVISIAIIPFLQVVIGWRYSTACPINQLISHYLIVAGIVSLVLIILIASTQIMTRTFTRKMFDDTVDTTNPNRTTTTTTTTTTTLVSCGVCSIMCINFSLLIFLIGWSILGWIWVIEVWPRVQYRLKDKEDYCHPLLYQFTFSLLLFITTCKLIFFCFVCRKTCVKVRSSRRKDRVTSDEF